MHTGSATPPSGLSRHSTCTHAIAREIEGIVYYFCIITLPSPHASCRVSVNDCQGAQPNLKSLLSAYLQCHPHTSW